jgi:hypothetical protein
MTLNSPLVEFFTLLFFQLSARYGIMDAVILQGPFPSMIVASRICSSGVDGFAIGRPAGSREKGSPSFLAHRWRFLLIARGI